MPSDGDVIPGISYGRVSGEKQLSGKGLERSLAGCLGWIAKHPEHHVRLDHTLVDRALSAWKGEHITDGEFGRLLRMIAEGVIRAPCYLFVDDHDRISRRPVWEATHLLTGLIKDGITVVTTIDGKFYNQQSGVGDLITSVVKMNSAHEQSESKSQRVKFTKAARVAECQMTKHVLHQMVPHWLHVADAVTIANRATRKPEKIDRHVQTVQEMYQMALHHGASYITAWLIKNREPFGRSGKWNTLYVRKILSSRAVLGHLESRHGTIEEVFPRIIDDDLWLRVQSACAARRGHGGHKTHAYVNLFATLCRCADCGGMMRINTNGRTGYKYYECKNHSSLRECANRCRYRVEIIERAVLDDLNWLSVAPAPKATPEDLSALAKTVATLEARETRLAKRLKALDDDEMFDTVMKQLRDLRGEVNDAKTRLSAAQQATAVAATPVEIGDLTDRPALHTALKQRLKGVYFGDDNEVMVVSQGGVLLMVVARQNAGKPYWFIAGADAQAALIREGKVSIVDAPAGMPQLDRHTADDLLHKLRRTNTA